MRDAGIFYLSKEQWWNFLKETASRHNVLAPVKGLFDLDFSPVLPEEIDNIILPGARLTQPVKSFLYPPKEGVTHPLQAGLKKTVILGVKACDLRAIAILDHIYLDPDYVDPFYKERRDNTILVSEDCTSPRDCCFCTLTGGNPFPESGFDLNLSFIGDGVLVEAGSEKGQLLIGGMKDTWEPADEKYLSLRMEERNKVKDKLREINKEFKFPLEDLPSLIETKYDSPVWKDACASCVGCCACTNICPSCHCFLLTETLPVGATGDGEFMTVRTWDSCQSTGFARVAGGANPRKELPKIFANRFYCKLQYKPRNYGIFACTGCGRCFEACQGKIDMRQVLTQLFG